jgi:hypothetical protein
MTDTVGIGTTVPGRLSKGNTKSYGLDLYGYSNTVSNLLRLVNTYNNSSNSKGTSIDFATTSSNNTIVNAKVVGKTWNVENTLGTLQFLVKIADTNSDVNDLEPRGSVEIDGLVSGSDIMSEKGFFSVKNIFGRAELGVDIQNFMSYSSVSGDTVLKTRSNGSNLILQSGTSILPAIYIAATNKSPPASYSRVGVGTTNPDGLLSVSYPGIDTSIYPFDTSTVIEPYLLHVKTGDTVNKRFNQTYKAPSIYLSSGNAVKYGEAGSIQATGLGARMEINGAGERGGTIFHGSIDFYTALASSGPTVTIGNTSYNMALSQTYFGLNMAYLATGSINIPSYAIYARGAVMSTSTFISTSDQRIKKNISPMDSRRALDMVNRLEVCEYDMRDSIQDPGRKVGVIAQQVREVVPEAVSVGEDQYVANVLGFVQKVYHDQGECVIHLFDPISIEEGENVKLIGDKGNDAVYTIITKKITASVYAVKDMLDISQRWMLYGTLEKSILAVDKPMLGMLALSAIKQLTQEIVEVKGEVEEMKVEMRELRKMLMELKR